MTQFDPPYAKPLPISEPDPQSLQQLIFGNEEEEAYRKVRARKRAEERYAEEHREHFAGVAGRSLRDLHLCPPPDIEWTIEKLAARVHCVRARDVQIWKVVACRQSPQVARGRCSISRNLSSAPSEWKDRLFRL